MFFILPLSHERMEVQRLPYITIGIVALNVLIFIVTAHIANKSEEALNNTAEEFLQYYFEHPYLDFPGESLNKFPPQVQTHIEYMKETSRPLEEVRERNVFMEESSDFFGKEDRKSIEENLKKRRQEEQAHLEELGQTFEKAYKNDFYRKYGYVPSRGGVATIFSSIFLHGGILHLVFNMLFLWLSGCNIEDLWGRVIYPIFYLLGGIIATLAHGMKYPDSSIPCIGASGAIAAVMGAFLIRLYDTKIQFVYFIFLGLRPKVGKFSAPAYVMLPLWFLDQLWEASVSGETSGVGFWAHIGGFVFGAIVATLFKVSGFESKVISPVLDKKTSVLDEHLASGMTKLQDGDVEGAFRDLREATRNNPNDPIAHSELSRAYFKKGDKKLALREFKRAVYLYIKQGRMNDAVDEYLEISAELPEMTLDPPQQMKIAAAIAKRASEERGQYSDEKEANEKERDMFAKAALAYRQLISHFQLVAKTLDTPEAVEALTHYGDICGRYLEQPQEAYKAYEIILRSSQLSPEQKQEFQTKAQQAMEIVSKQAKRTELLLQNRKEEKAQRIAEAQQREEKAQQTAETAPPQLQRPKPAIPVQKRIKLVQETPVPAKYQIGLVAPLEANKVLPVPGGMDLKRPSEKPVLFCDIYLICIAQIQEIIQRVKQVKKRGGKVEYLKSEDRRELIVADLFIGGKSRPYRIMSDRIDYSQFFSKPLESSLDNFRQYILYIISNIDSVYLDQGTLNFLKTGKARAFSSQNDLEVHEKILWKQLMGAVRFQCENCWEVYWVDGGKIPEVGARTKCTTCGHPIFVQRIKSE
jgi:membrane associated rhomboid family serine protease